MNRNSVVFKTCKFGHGVVLRGAFEIRKWFRVRGLESERYKKIQKYKGIHEGERCFIIATGPSLTIEDINKLKNEYTFGMNSMCKVFEQTGWETTYFGIQDFRVYRRLKADICNLKETELFVGDIVKNRGPIQTEWTLYPVNSLNHRYNMKKLTSDFSEDCYREVFDGYSIAYSLLQIAVYMGFKEIYLLGTLLRPEIPAHRTPVTVLSMHIIKQRSSAMRTALRFITLPGVEC